MSEVNIVNEVYQLKELLRTIIADGDFGVTLRTGEPPVVRTANGRRTVEGKQPTHEEITDLLRHMV